MIEEFIALPIDPTAAASLASNGLRFDVVDATDTDTGRLWVNAVTRGFHGPRTEGTDLEARVEGLLSRRAVGVWDDAGADAATPVATSSAWPTDLTVPGRKTVKAWAISTVTVAPTHRRRGIARNILESELRTAAALGIPVAILTVSEATIYARFGFAPATFIAKWTVKSKRATWTGPVPSGRVQLVAGETIRDAGGLDVVERAALDSPGQIRLTPMLWKRLFGTPGETEAAKDRRAVRYDDEHGALQGFAVYHVTETPDKAELEVDYLSSATADAYAALWRYLFDVDLIDEVTAGVRPIDEAFSWQISDWRAAVKSGEQELLWTRILDVKASLEARTYGAAGSCVFEVSDALGFAEGWWRLDVGADGRGEVTAVDRVREDEASVALSINELSAIYLGGVSAVQLVAAGRITEMTPGAATAIDAAFRSPVTPWLSTWF
jgi:predicted acetyltransferase